jgi:hypothetical protein
LKSRNRARPTPLHVARIRAPMAKDVKLRRRPIKKMQRLDEK